MSSNTTTATVSSVSIPSGTVISSLSSIFDTTTTSSSSFLSTDLSSTTTTPLPTTTSYVSQSPTSTVVITPTPSTSVTVISSTVIITPSDGGAASSSVAVVTITSTQAPVTITPSNTNPVSSASSSSASPSILSQNGSGSSGGGLSSSGKIAIAVIIPIIVVALLFGLGLFLWRKRRERQSAEEQRKDEMAEYGFNPNNDPTLVPVGAAYTDGASEADDGYRGWGTTSSNARKPSTTLGSNGKAPNVMAYSDTTSQPGNYGSPNGLASEHWPADPLMGGHPEGVDSIGALGGAAAAGGTAAAMASRNNRVSNSGVQRGPSNASSSYSHNPPQSETSSDTPGLSSYYQEEVPYNIYNDVAPSHGPYGDGAYNAPENSQPVIRDVQARRNTKIERVPTFPQTQGGIAQNF